MKYIFDGTLEGLFTSIFKGYKDIQNINFCESSLQTSFLSDEKTIKTDMNLYKRVKDSIVEYFGYGFIIDIKSVMKSDNVEKYDAIARVIKGSFIYGKEYLTCSSKDSFLFNELLKNYHRECHAYKGLLRFKEINEFYYAEFEPLNDVLEEISIHFKKRMPNEKFIILDKNRKKASLYYGEKLIYKEVNDIINFNTLMVNEESRDEFFEKCWKTFYDTVSIDERKNPNLMRNNMPKRYWKYLTERK